MYGNNGNNGKLNIPRGQSINSNPSDYYSQQDLDSAIDKIETPDYNYECQHCQQPAEIEDVHKKHEPNWCDRCGTVRTFVKMETEE